jgi:Fur family peroxide stress response transcriptional regulator
MGKESSSELCIIQLKNAGMRVTPQRLAIFRALVDSDAHPTAQTLFEQLQDELPSLSQATVYNTLQALTEHGLIQEIGDAGCGAMRYDGNPKPHVNLVCSVCHNVSDVFEVPVDDITEIVATRTRFDARGVRISVYGLCWRCQKKRQVH